MHIYYLLLGITIRGFHGHMIIANINTHEHKYLFCTYIYSYNAVGFAETNMGRGRNNTHIQVYAGMSHQIIFN